MKWFIKALRHYADFSGRSRRKEYWMFALFNLIFLFVWALLIGLLSGNNFDEETVPLVLQFSMMGLLGLPGLAVAVRRLHDLGKSGWMVLVALIPLAGGIWLLILMVTDGQHGPNRFGPDPKTSPETFDDRVKFTSAGIALTVAASLSILSVFLSVTMRAPFHTVQSIVLNGLVMAAGIVLINSVKRENTRPALFLLLAVFAIRCLQSLGSMVNVPYSSAYFLLDIALALLTVSLLFAPHNRNFVLYSALATIVMSGVIILLRTRMMVRWGGIEMDDPHGIMEALTLIIPAAYMVLAWTFLPKTGEAAVPSAETASETAHAAHHTAQKLPEGEALLHLYRPSKMAGAMIGYDVYLDGAMVWRAKNGSKTMILTREGTAVLMAKTESRKEMSLEIRSGHEYYVRFGLKMGVMVGRPDLKVVDGATGKSEFDKIS